MLAAGSDRQGLVRAIVEAAGTLASQPPREIGLVMASEGLRLRMAVDLAGPAPTAVRDLMRGAQGPLLAGRFDALMESREVVAIYFRTPISAEALMELADQLSTDEEEPLAVRLLEAGVLEAQVLRATDLIAPSISLPWRVRMALSRIPHALRAAPVLAQTTGEPYEQARRRSLAGATGSLRGGGELRTLLEHLPRALRALHGRPPGREELDALGSELLDGVPVDERVVLAGALLAEVQRQGARSGGADRRAPALTALRWIGRSLVGSADRPAVGALLEQLGLARVLDPSELPVLLREQLADRNRCETAVRAPGEALAALVAARDPETYRLELRAVLRAYPDLARGGRRAEVAAVVATLGEHVHQEWRSTVIRSTLSDRADLGISHALTTLFLRGTPTERLVAGELLAALGDAALPLLLSCLEDRSVEARRLLADRADAEWLAAQLAEPQRPAEALCALIGMLTDQGSERHTAALAPLLTHGDSTVREAALRATVLLRGPDALAACLDRLQDSAANVVERAIHLLEVLEHRSPQFIDRLLTLAEATDDLHPDRLRVAATETLGRLPMDPDDRARVSHALADLLPGFGESRWRLRRRAVAGRRPPRLRAAIYRSLARLAAPAGEAALEKGAARDPDTAARAAAREALAHYRKRAKSNRGIR